jgi:hypothetical protein
MPLAGFEPAVKASAQPKIYSLYHVATGIGVMTFLSGLKMQHVIYFGTFSFLPITVTSCILL